MADETPEDDNKRKFREALERKKTQANAGASHADAGRKQSRAHGAADNSRREFRRKSG
ncbi:DUF5302 domain-containing protein [Mycolicibacterium diernhoferi]|uniref:DUF5302 domain-containing protein n=1 Tax=Mycolicibacterium diernhoferi TaxID=1801 RepID=A0A2A7NZA0_9MYCO|nr:DUF5302 domain-containing protein [Mycolicibacterium diernhoferi]PEG55315.1 hypothetical protein CRI78_07020 [Mycolicibacterium diernhoferi]QYL21663.1 DUF5302 domain-containing protein [Mycolicibacterium diernhoferi]